MKTMAMLSLGLAAVSTVFAAQYQEASVATNTSLASPRDKWMLHVNSISGNPPMFKDRPLVALTEGTIDGIPQNHAPQTQVHLPATFGLENFTMRPASTPVIFTLSHVGEQFGSRYSLTSVPLTEPNFHVVDFVSQYIFRAPNNFIAMGFSTVLGARDCPNNPQGLRCDPLSWDIQEGEQRLLKPMDQAGAWDAVKTKEGHGWRVVWKVDKATVQSEVQISVVPFDK